MKLVSLTHLLLAFSFALSLVVMPFIAMAQPYLFVNGYGQTQREAEVDAKLQLALMISSQVEVSEKSSQIKHNDMSNTFYSLDSAIKSVPIRVQNLEVDSYYCQQGQCDYRFRIDKLKWAERLESEIYHDHSIARSHLNASGSTWRDLKSLNESQHRLITTSHSLIVMSSITSNNLSDLIKTQTDLEQQAIEREKVIRISIRSATDVFSSEVKGLLSQTMHASANGDIIVYIKGTFQQGKQANLFIAKQTLLLQVFEANDPGQIVSQKKLSETATSLGSHELALTAARQKLTKTIINNSIYSLLD